MSFPQVTEVEKKGINFFLPIFNLILTQMVLKPFPFHKKSIGMLSFQIESKMGE